MKSDYYSLLVSIIAIITSIASVCFTCWFNKKLEDYKQELLLRERTTKIAEYLSEIMAPRLDPVKYKHDLRIENKLAWELLILLPEDTYFKLLAVLKADDDQQKNNIFNILIEVRDTLHSKDTKITVDDIFFHLGSKD